MSNITQKRCSTCREIKPVSEFYERKDRPIGYSSNCKKCGVAYTVKWNKDHPEISSQRIKDWHSSHKEQDNARDHELRLQNIEEEREKERRYADANRESIRENYKRWEDSHPIEERRAAKAIVEENRRARKRKNGGVVTAIEWEGLKNKYKNRCLRCGASDKKLTMDHVIPVSKGGPHTIENIQPLCKTCNCTKHTATTDYRPGE